MDCEIPGFGERGIAPWNVPGPCEERAWKSGAFQTKTKIRPLRRNACDTVQSRRVGHTSSIFQMHQHYAAVSVSWLTSVVTPTAPRRDFNNALYWCKISIKSSSLHDLQSFTTKRTNWVVLVFFAFFPTLNHTIVTISNVTAWPSRDVAKARGSDFEVNQVRSSCPSADRVLSPWARFSWREVH